MINCVYLEVKAKILFYEKQYIGKSFILEMVIWEVPQRVRFRFPSGLKYKLILVNCKTGRRVLMDNHHPKGHHIHLDEAEFIYDFEGIEQLVKDFKIFCMKHLGVSI